jgi:hypothetical protein
MVLDDQPRLNEWMEIGRNPSADFPSAPWSRAAYVKVSVGFLCAAGLTGASYGLYFDDFVLESDSGDADSDGLRDLEEETRIHAAQLSDPDVPLVVPAPGELNITLTGPSASGDLVSGLVAVNVVHPRPGDLSVSLVVRNGTEEISQLLWDPSAYERGVAITSPSPGESVHGTIVVTGRVSPLLSDGSVRLVVGNVPQAAQPEDGRGGFAIPLHTEAMGEGVVTLRAEATGPSVGWSTLATSAPVSVIIDRTPPELALSTPANGSDVAGLFSISADAYDAQGVSSVEFLVDGVRVDARVHEPFEFALDSADLTNAEHRVGVRAVDPAGNTATRWVAVRVGNRASSPPPPCRPACNLTGGTTTGNLAPVQSNPRAWGITVASGDRLDVSEGLQVPWRPQVTRTENRAWLVLRADQGGLAVLTDGVVASNLTAAEFAGSGLWRIVVRDHVSGDSGFVQHASVRFAMRTLLSLRDTDGDGLLDGLERSLPSMSPVFADLDGDRLSDGWESRSYSVLYTVDGQVRFATVRTDPLDADTDDDGLTDGDEYYPPDGWNVTNPDVPDTDGDGLLDGAERYTHGSDPTRTDTDGDTLGDAAEVTPGFLSLVIDGVAEVRSVVTNPGLRDTDDDTLRDDAEWNGDSLWGFTTDPSDPDTDRDGLNDGDEVRGMNRRPTNPLESDTDRDGIWDSLDLSPTETWSLPWSTTYAPGLVRFDQAFNVWDLHGVEASVHELLDGVCTQTSDHTLESTRSSNETPENVAAAITKMFTEGGEYNLSVLSAERVDSLFHDWSVHTYCNCSEDGKEYRIVYLIEDHLYRISFVNNQSMTIHDESGLPFYHASLQVPMTPEKAQSIIVQMRVASGEDRAGLDDSASILPVLTYSLFPDDEFYLHTPFYSAVAVGSPLQENVYQFNLRVPRAVIRAEDLALEDGAYVATLDFTPAWFVSDGLTLSRVSINATHLSVGAMLAQRQVTAESVIVRRNVDLHALEAVLPASFSDWPTGLAVREGVQVYTYHLGDVFDPNATENAVVVVLVGDSPEELSVFQEAISWNPPEAWTQTVRNEFGVSVGVMKILQRGISITSQLLPFIQLPEVSVPTLAFESMSYERSASMLFKFDAETGGIWYEFSETSSITIKYRLSYPGLPDSRLTDVEVGDRQLDGDLADDLDELPELSGTRFTSLKAGLRGAALGATLVICGGQAVLAFRDGDTIKGTIYVAAGATSTFGILRGNVELIRNAFKFQGFGRGVALRLGVVAGLAVGGILAGYELFAAGSTDNPILSMVHRENAVSIVLDSLIGVLPLYGPSAMLGWQVGLGVAILVQGWSGTVSNPLALRICSSPGTTITFLLEFYFGDNVPAAFAEDAYTKVVNFLADTVMFCNRMGIPIPSALLVP